MFPTIASGNRLWFFRQFSGVGQVTDTVVGVTKEVRGRLPPEKVTPLLQPEDETFGGRSSDEEASRPGMSLYSFFLP